MPIKFPIFYERSKSGESAILVGADAELVGELWAITDEELEALVSMANKGAEMAAEPQKVQDPWAHGWWASEESTLIYVLPLQVEGSKEVRYLSSAFTNVCVIQEETLKRCAPTYLGASLSFEDVRQRDPSWDEQTYARCGGHP